MRKIILVLFLTFGALHAQSTNLEMIYSLVDKSASEISRKLNSNYLLNFDSPAEYLVLKTRVMKAFASNPDGAKELPELSYSIVNARVEYSDIFRDGFLGSFKVKRKITLNADYALHKEGNTITSGSFEQSLIDTVDYDSVNKLENFSLPFTQGTLPDEPFFSGLLEPVVAIGTAVVAVYLLFTVRSK